MSLKDYIAECGCVIEMNITHDWDSGTTDAEDISIITPCKKHAVKEVLATPSDTCLQCGSQEFIGLPEDETILVCGDCGKRR